MNRRLSIQHEQKSRARSMPRQTNQNRMYSPSPEASPEPSPALIPKRLHPSERHKYLVPPLRHQPDQSEDEEVVEIETPVRRVRRREKHVLPPSPRIMSPIGFAINRQARLQHCDEESMYDDDGGEHYSELPIRVRPVPLWLCVFLVIGYIVAGAFYFKSTEGWSFLDSVYFCFITLTTIGMSARNHCYSSDKVHHVSIGSFQASEISCRRRGISPRTR